MTKRSIVVLGDVNVDILVRLPDRAREGSLAAVPEPELFGGGTGGNTSVALARLGLPVAFVGMIGDDLYGRDVRAGLEAEGVDLSGLCVTSEYPTATVIAIGNPMATGRGGLAAEGGAHAPAPRRPRSAPDRAGGVAATTGMCLDQRPVSDALLRGMRIARDAGVPVSLDLNLRLVSEGTWREGQREAVGAGGRAGGCGAWLGRERSSADRRGLGGGRRARCPAGGARRSHGSARRARSARGRAAGDHPRLLGRGGGHARRGDAFNGDISRGGWPASASQTQSAGEQSRACRSRESVRAQRRHARS